MKKILKSILIPLAVLILLMSFMAIKGCKASKILSTIYNINSEKEALTGEYRTLRSAPGDRENFVAPGNQYYSGLIAIPHKIYGVGQVEIDGIKQELPFINFRISQIPDNTILCYFNSTPGTGDYLKWRVTGNMAQISLFINSRLIDKNVYYYVNAESRLYIQVLGVPLILTPYVASYNGDVVTNYYSAFFSYFCEFQSPRLLDNRTIAELYDWAKISENYTSKNKANATYSYYQIVTNSESYQQGFDVGYGAGEEDGYQTGQKVGYIDGEKAGYNNGYAVGQKQGVIDGTNAVVNSPQDYELKTLEQYNEYGKSQYVLGENEGAKSNISINWLTKFFGTMTEFLSIEIFPNIKLIYLFGIMIIFGFVRVVLRWFK